ncbi:hypothetical protein P9X10_00445 [Bacillus cereus]|nr:hypothetical protein [Bacillus cereus]
MKELLRNKKVLISLGVVVVVGIGGWIGYSKYEDHRLYEMQQDQLVKDAQERDKKLEELRKSELKNSNAYKFNKQERKEVKESKLDKDDLDLAKRFNRSEVETHAKTILSINDKESREYAMNTLPLSKEATKKYFGNADKIYYGGYNSVSVAIQFTGVDYSETDKNYKANVIAKVTSRNKGDDKVQPKVEVMSLVIEYRGNELLGWKY